MFADINTKHKKEYLRKGITSDALMRRVFPNKYKDYTRTYLLKEAGLTREGRDVAVLGTVREAVIKHTSNGAPMLVVKAYDREDTPFSARFICMAKLHPLFKAYVGSELFFGGVFQHDPIYGYSVFNPAFSANIQKEIRYKPIYGSIKNISEASHIRHIADAVSEKEIETIPAALLGKYPEINEAFRMIHFPKNGTEAELGKDRILLDDIVYFKLRLIEEQTGTLSRFTLPMRDYMEHQIRRFPYSLTGDQRASVNGILAQSEGGRRIRALVQGDVGSGKTAVAFCLMFCAAENGYLSVLMAPTQVLARQHYEELCRYTGNGEVAFVDSSLKKKERLALSEKVDSGSIRYLVGTSALLTFEFDREKIGLAVIDEEHRFGVEQRTGLYNSQTHIIIMSATPIPRTLAQSIYGTQTTIYQIREKPAGRLPVKTYYDNEQKAKNFLYARLKEGGQAYVICASKEDAGAEQKSVIKSASETYNEYRKLFEPLGFRVGLVTGSSGQAEKAETLDAFSEGRIHILVGTTVVEVGVNVPNATVIMILNAERFGLATLHQLRGRVGRGTKQSYCILVSETLNDRIRAMCLTDDGFRIAEEDLKERKSGDLLGLKQTGKNKYVEEILDHPEIAEDADEVVRKIDFQSAVNHLGKYRFIYGQD